MDNTSLAQIQDHVEKSILDRDLIDQIVTIISMGNYYTAACAALMINYYTFQRWMRVGKVDASHGKDTLYAELYHRVRQADAMAEIYTVNTWRKHAEKDANANRDFAARRWPDRWSERKILDVRVEKEITQLFKELEARLPPEIVDMLRNELAAIGAGVIEESGAMDEQLVTDDESDG